MKSTLAELRDLPSYPKIVIRIIAVYLLIFAVSGLTFGIPMVLGNADITITVDLAGFAVYLAVVSVGAFLSFMQGFTGIGTVGGQFLLPPNFQSSAVILGVLTAIFGVLFLWIAIQLLRGRGRKFARNVHAIYFAIGLLIIIPSIFFNFNVLYLIFRGIIPLIILLLLTRDNRIKAYFGEGPYAEAYAFYWSEKYRGNDNPPSPWSIAIPETGTTDFSLTMPSFSGTGATLLGVGMRLILAAYHVLLGVILFLAARRGNFPPAIGADVGAVTFMRDTLGWGAFFQPHLSSDVLWLYAHQHQTLDILAILAIVVGIGIFSRRRYFRIPALILNGAFLFNWVFGDFSTYTALAYGFLAMAIVTLALLLYPPTLKGVLPITEIPKRLQFTLRGWRRLIAGLYIFFGAIFVFMGVGYAQDGWRRFFGSGYPLVPGRFPFSEDFAERMALRQQWSQIALILGIVTIIIGIGLFIRRPIFRIPAIVFSAFMVINWLLGDIGEYALLAYVLITLSAATVILLLFHRGFIDHLTRNAPAIEVDESLVSG